MKMFHVLESVDYFEPNLYVQLWSNMAQIVEFVVQEKIESVQRTTTDFTTIIAFKALEVDKS